jgi:hypothetical protein
MWALRAPGEEVFVKRIQENPELRIRRMVSTSDLVLAAPGTREVQFSGTWDMIRAAREARIRTCIIYPNGTTEWESG